jgi:hypothetical protein
MEMSGHVHILAALTLGKEPPRTHCIGGWVGPQSRSGRCGEEKNLLPLPGVEPRLLGCPARPHNLIKYRVETKLL